MHTSNLILFLSHSGNSLVRRDKKFLKIRHWEHLDLLFSLFYFPTYRIDCKLKNKSIGNKGGLTNLSLQIPATVVGSFAWSMYFYLPCN